MPRPERAPGPEQVVEQMAEATGRLRDKAWMVAPLTHAVAEPMITTEEPTTGGAT